jgi:hypothetical protein
MTTSALYAVPEELRLLKNWCLWKYVKVDGSNKPTKVPYQINGEKASVTEQSHWSTFIECFNCLSIGSYDGLGFVFTNTPYSGIDLDDPSSLIDGSTNPNYQLDIDRQIKISQSFDSYSEVSPSGKGLHIIVKGFVVAGRKRNKIEIYSTGRFFTMTGNVHNNKPITNQQESLLSLWEQMGNPISASIFKGDLNEKETDDTIIRNAREAVNGEKFNQLYCGDWQSLYSSQSEADFAIIDIISFYTQNKNQIERIFIGSQLGRRDKAKRKDYVSGMISRSFDRMLPNVDIEGMQNAVELKLAQAQLALPLTVSSNGRTSAFDAENVGSTPTTVANGPVAQWSEPAAHNGSVAGSSPAGTTTSLPPGLLGDLAQFIYAAAPRPVPEVALAAAIGLMAGICGRAYNVSGTGLNQYILLLAMTGIGKEAAAEGIDKLMATIKMQVPTSTTFIGPGELPSGTGLIKHLANKSQSFVSIVGEFGLKLQQMSNASASSSEISLRRIMLDLYNKSGANRFMPASAYSKKEDSTNSIPSPAFTLLGESTPERFYGALSEDMISEGLLPRFLLIEYKGERPSLNEYHTQAQIPFTLIERLAALCAQCETINHSNPRRVVNVQESDIASKMLKDFDKYADSRIRGSKEVIRQLWNRAHVKVLKLSALIAVGENMIEPTIQPYHMQWAADLVQSDIKSLTLRFEAGEIGTNSFEIKQASEIVRVIKDYVTQSYEDCKAASYSKMPNLHTDRVIPYAYIQRRLVAAAAFRNDKAQATFAIKRAIQNLVDADRIKELGRILVHEKYKTSQRCFVVSDFSILD